MKRSSGENFQRSRELEKNDKRMIENDFETKNIQDCSDKSRYRIEFDALPERLDLKTNEKKYAREYFSPMTSNSENLKLSARKKNSCERGENLNEKNNYVTLPGSDVEPANEWLDASQDVTNTNVPSEFKPRPKLKLKIYHLHARKRLTSRDNDNYLNKKNLFKLPLKFKSSIDHTEGKSSPSLSLSLLLIIQKLDCPLKIL